MGTHHCPSPSIFPLFPNQDKQKKKHLCTKPCTVSSTLCTDSSCTGINVGLLIFFLLDLYIFVNVLLFFLSSRSLFRVFFSGTSSERQQLIDILHTLSVLPALDWSLLWPWSLIKRLLHCQTQMTAVLSTHTLTQTRILRIVLFFIASPRKESRGNEFTCVRFVLFTVKPTDIKITQLTPILVAGSDVLFECNTYGSKPMPVVYWVFDGQRYDTRIRYTSKFASRMLPFHPVPWIYL